MSYSRFFATNPEDYTSKRGIVRHMYESNQQEERESRCEREYHNKLYHCKEYISQEKDEACEGKAYDRFQNCLGPR